MLKEEVEKFSRLSGEDGQHTSICRIGAYLDGYNRGLSEDRWIPCSERLPEVSTEPYATSVDGIDKERFELHESERVLVACIAEGYTTYGIGVVIYDAINKTTEWAGSAFGDYDLAYPNYCKVIAWMPLTKPYEPKEDK